MTLVPISQLKFFPGNARRGDIDLIADSLKRLGQYKPVVVNRGTHAPELAHTICAGNHTVMAAQRLGWDEVDVHWIDVDADTAKRITLVDNASADKATYDVDELLALIQDLPDLDATGFTQPEVDALLEAIEAPGDDELPDDLPADADGDGYALLVECDNADQRDTLKAKLLAEGFNVGNA